MRLYDAMKHFGFGRKTQLAEPLIEREPELHTPCTHSTQPPMFAQDVALTREEGGKREGGGREDEKGIRMREEGEKGGGRASVGFQTPMAELTALPHTP